MGRMVLWVLSLSLLLPIAVEAKAKEKGKEKVDFASPARTLLPIQKLA